MVLRRAGFNIVVVGGDWVRRHCHWVDQINVTGRMVIVKYKIITANNAIELGNKVTEACSLKYAEHGNQWEPWYGPVVVVIPPFDGMPHPDVYFYQTLIIYEPYE